MDKKWLVKRLKTMSVGEINYRTGKIIRFKIFKPNLKQPEKLNNVSLNFPLDFSTVDFDHWNRDNFDAYVQKILNGKFEVFETEIDLCKCDDWLTDPITGRQWSPDYFMNINYRNPDCPGDPKVIWEINRMQFLVLLGIAYRKDKNEEFAHKIVNFIVDWIDSNPMYIGINWVSSLELAIRIISWMFSLCLIRDSKALTELVKAKIAKSVYQQADFIYHYLSLYSSANNHLIGELTGLIYASYLINASNKELIWRNKAIRLLEDQVSEQFYSDGVNKEQSIFYQCYTMEYYFLSDYIIKINSSLFNNHVYQTLAKACSYLADISNSSGGYPNLGDEDGGYGLLADTTENKVLSILSFATMLLDHDYIDGKDKYIDSKSLLLFGDKYIKTVHSIQKVKLAHKLLSVYPEGGYALIKDYSSDGPKMITFDFGPIGKKPISAHGHADILSIQVLYRDTPFIIDPGTYKYFFSDGYRDYFKGTTAHNTISVNYENQLPDYGMFLWGDHPNVKFDSGNDSNSIFVEAEHNGYFEKFGVTHKRRIELRDNILYICDTINSKQNNSFQQFFHLHPDVKLKNISDHQYELISDGKRIVIEMDANFVTELKKGQQNPIKLGWFSSSFYSLKEATTFENSIVFQGKKCFVTKIIF